ncbi:MAG TPA: alpha/beta fold hydrolase [archaeon]|nr:alpha/beta fold hydrolase [archaeon]
MKKIFSLLCFCLIVSSVHGFPDETSQDSYKVLPLEGEFADQSIMLFKHLSRQGEKRAWQREVELGRIRNLEDWSRYKQKLLDNYRLSLGLPFPEKNALNVEKVRVLDRGAYRIENLIYQSLPDIYVTANLYVPQKGEPPYPGILFPCGHSANGKAYELYHSAALGLVAKGYVVLVYDPPGQGERYQYLKDDGTPYLGSTTEHSLLANPLFLMGKHLMAVRMWEGMRGIDYLLSLPEVDPERIGCTGNSGGGTVTLHLAPLEPRIKVAVPAGTVNSPDMELGTGGIGDGEQNLPRLVPCGITHADLMMLAYPRPYRLIKESRGGVFQGTRASFVQAAFLYETLGHGERMSYVETEWPHGYFKAMREPMYQWFGKWFYGREDDHQEPELSLEEEKDLMCSKSGQILNERGLAIWQWAARELEKSFPRRPVPRTAKDWQAFKEPLLKETRELLNNPDKNFTPLVKTLDTLEEDQAVIEKLVLYTEDDIYLPCLYFKPKRGDKIPTAILVDSQGKTADQGTLARKLAEQGYGVFAVDLRGMGETRITKQSERDNLGGFEAQTLGQEASAAYDGLKLGRSVFAMRVYDLLKVVDYLCSRNEVEQGSGVALIGKSSCGPLALYAAALDERIKGVILDSSLVSFSELVNSRYYTYNFMDFLPGVLRCHDLPQVAGSLAPRTLWIMNSLDAQKNHKEKSLVEQTYNWSQGCYRTLKAEKSFQVRTYSTLDQQLNAYLDWIGSLHSIN